MSRFGLLVPILLLALAVSAVGAVLAAVADALGWVALRGGGERTELSRFFAGWPLVLWGFGVLMLPDLPWRLASLAMLLEHGALTALWRQRPEATPDAISDR